MLSSSTAYTVSTQSMDFFPSNWFGVFITMARHVTDSVNVSFFTGCLAPTPGYCNYSTFFVSLHYTWSVGERPSFLIEHWYLLSALSWRVLVCAQGMSVRICELALICELAVIYISIVVSPVDLNFCTLKMWMTNLIPFQQKACWGLTA